MSSFPQQVDCLIISVGRSASTAVYKYFNDACQLNLPLNKEPHFWCDITKYQGRYKSLDDIYIKDWNEYFGLYSGSAKVIDASVGYFFCIDEVVRKLEFLKQKPKVIFLYREPVSRACSLYNELERKGLTTSCSVDQEVSLKKDAGLWWECYYDNVMYMDNFRIMESYFDELLLVSYDAFRASPVEAFSRMADFAGMSIVSEIDYCPVNTSAEAKMKSGFKGLKSMASLLPSPAKAYLKRHLMKMLAKEARGGRGDLTAYLPLSIDQYDKFRRHIENRDILCLSK